MRDTLVCNSSLSPLEAWSILIHDHIHMTMNHYGRNIATLHQYSTHIMWETRHCHVIVETFPATKRERGALRQRERRELTNGGGNGTGGRPVRTGSLRLAVREHGRPRERARLWEPKWTCAAERARTGATKGTASYCSGNRVWTEN